MPILLHQIKTTDKIYPNFVNHSLDWFSRLNHSLDVLEVLGTLKFISWNLTSKVMVWGVRTLVELVWPWRWSLLDGISTYIKKTSQNSFAPLSHIGTMAYMNKYEVLRHQVCSTLVLDFISEVSINEINWHIPVEGIELSWQTAWLADRTC